MMTLGQRISMLRRQKGYTQEELANLLNLTPQAVSKWETDSSCPDILLVPRLAALLGVTSDELLSGEPPKETVLLPKEKQRALENLLLKVNIHSANGDKVRVNLPMPLVKLALDMGMSAAALSGGAGQEAFRDIDLEKILFLVEKGVIGKIVEVESAQGDHVEVVVE